MRNSDVIKTNFELLFMQLFSLTSHHSVDVSFVLISRYFAEQQLFEAFVPILEQLSGAYAKESCGVLAA